jgi:hypothetical protein
MNHEAMMASLADCRVGLQKLVPRISPADCQRLAAGIVGEIDLIERTHSKGFTWSGSGTAATIDGAKLRIIHSLREISKRAGLPLELPKSLTEELIWGRAEADRPPEGHETWEGWIGGAGGFKG